MKWVLLFSLFCLTAGDDQGLSSTSKSEEKLTSDESVTELPGPALQKSSSVDPEQISLEDSSTTTLSSVPNDVSEHLQPSPQLDLTEEGKRSETDVHEIYPDSSSPMETESEEKSASFDGPTSPSDLTRIGQTSPPETDLPTSTISSISESEKSLTEVSLPIDGLSSNKSLPPDESPVEMIYSNNDMPTATLRGEISSASSGSEPSNDSLSSDESSPNNSSVEKLVSNDNMPTATSKGDISSASSGSESSNDGFSSDNSSLEKYPSNDGMRTTFEGEISSSLSDSATQNEKLSTSTNSLEGGSNLEPHINTPHYSSSLLSKKVHSSEIKPLIEDPVSQPIVIFQYTLQDPNLTPSQNPPLIEKVASAGSHTSCIEASGVPTAVPIFTGDFSRAPVYGQTEAFMSSYSLMSPWQPHATHRTGQPTYLPVDATDPFPSVNGLLPSYGGEPPRDNLLRYPVQATPAAYQFQQQAAPDVLPISWYPRAPLYPSGENRGKNSFGELSSGFYPNIIPQQNIF